MPDELRLSLSLDYEIDGLEQEDQEVVDDAVRIHIRRLAAALADDLEERGVEGVRIRVEGD